MNYDKVYLVLILRLSGVKSFILENSFLQFFTMAKYKFTIK